MAGRRRTPRDCYHTALRHGTVEQAAAIPFFACPYGIGFQHDLRLGLPEPYQQAEVLYLEIPWAAGFAVFERRAGSTGRHFTELMQSLTLLATRTPVPVVIICGQREAQAFPHPTQRAATTLRGGRAWVVAYRLTLSRLASEQMILAELAERYRVLGDPMCGYGNAVLPFCRPGRRFIASDYNAACIGVLQRRVMMQLYGESAVTIPDQR